ncbi:regulatory protein RecX [Miniphocaeibacter halophilus]|uniref:RecX family transcriptional regulator n=1 Tax=Miniphocaeibacter halophilus TaxID=2931922 RepID=A0AC61MPQ4_9FIRM|nr:RecX family transcriptional regulator [Miniphocaeibacter halophilus]QQK07580.1 RecX family transcriptional regulator [Miniphocaeibacter halophilus]
MIIKEINFNDHKDQFDIILENKKIFHANYKLYNELNLYRGKELSSDDLKQLIEYDNFTNLLSISINFISYRIRTEKEIVNRLKKEKATEVEIENIVSYLKNLNMIDDLSFTKVFYNNKSQVNKWSSKKIKYELYLKGISNEVFDNVIEDTYETDFNNAVHIIKKKYNIWKNKYDKYKLKNKIYSTLSQKGFSYDIITAVIEEFHD